MTRREEVALVVYRHGPEFLVLLRSPESHGYWHLVAGGIEQGEEPAEAALRELDEETALQPIRFAPLPLELAYHRADGYRMRVHPFLAEAPMGWEPTLNEEHVDYRWLDEDGAIERLEFPEPKTAVRNVARQLDEEA